jgi:hypothetical protein
MKPSTIKSFAAMYAFLGIWAILVSVACWKELTSSPASKSAVTQVEKRVNQALEPGKKELIKTACDYVTQQAASQGLTFKSCVLDPRKDAFQTKGNKAQVRVDAISDQADKSGKIIQVKYVLAVELGKGIWRAGGLQVVEAKPVK